MFLCHDLDKIHLDRTNNIDMLSLSKCTSMKPPVTCRMESSIKRMNARSS